MRHADCPVAVIRDEDPLMPDPQHAPVLVGIDGSPASELATAIAFDEASRRGVELMALHAWSDVAMYELPGLDWAAVEVGSGAQSRRKSGGLARTLPRRHGAPSDRMRSTGATARSKSRNPRSLSSWVVTAEVA